MAAGNLRERLCERACFGWVFDRDIDVIGDEAALAAEPRWLNSGRIAICDRWPVTRSAAATTSAVTPRISRVGSERFAQPAREAREMRRIASSAVSAGDPRRFSKGSSAISAYAAFCAAAPCKISSAFFTTGSVGELDGGAGFWSVSAAMSPGGAGTTTSVGVTPSTGISLPPGV